MRPGSPACDGDVAANRALYKHRAAVLCDGLNAAGWPVERPTASMFVWAPLPVRAAGQGAVKFAADLLEKARVAVSPGVGFGPGGEGYVRFALVESDERAKKACAAIAAFLSR